MAREGKSLEAYRQELLVKSALQREQLAADLARLWQPGAALASGRKALVEAAGKKPLVSGAVALFAFFFLRRKVFGLFKRRGLFSLLATGMVVFKTWSRFAPFVLPAVSRIRQFSRRK